MRRLYLQIYLAFVGMLLVFAIASSFAWWALRPTDAERRMIDALGGILAELLPGPERPKADLEAALAKLASRFPADLAVRGPDGALLASVGAPLPDPGDGGLERGVLRGGVGRSAVALRLPDGRVLVARHVHDHRGAVAGWLASVALLATLAAGAAWPVVRRITRRLERLRTRVEQLGAGDFGARVEVEGNDEVAGLARSFNRAAERIDALVGAQRTLLASASHELRTPLTRIRLAIELLGDGGRPELRERIARDIGELDELIGELLLASRLDAAAPVLLRDDVDLLALAAEECARANAPLADAASEACASGESVRLQGDARMLRRLVRNLVENARRHAPGSAIEVGVDALPAGGARLRVADRGPGVRADERERIFEPFYRPAGMREGEGGGVGLGLALVRQIARRHDGDAQCLPRDGGGTVFEVTLYESTPARHERATGPA